MYNINLKYITNPKMALVFDAATKQRENDLHNESPQGAEFQSLNEFITLFGLAASRKHITFKVKQRNSK